MTTERDAAKDEFLATLVHELRNPLGPIRTAVELMKLAPEDPQVAVSSREIIERQLARMVRLLDDLLDLSRVSQGVVELRRARLPLAQVLRDAVEASRPLIVQFAHLLTVTLPEDDVCIRADPTRMVQVFTNLLGNAARFTPRGGRIELSARPVAGDRVVVSVCDSGLGIPREMLTSVFDTFVQVERSQAQVGGGLGIGLTLVRRLVELHGGSVEARSEGLGCGSELLVRLPLAQEVETESEPEVTLRKRPASPPRVEPEEPRRRRIVVADDNIDAAESLSQMLRMVGHETRTAHDGEDAFRVACEFQPDAMVLDIAMPGLDGHDLARRIRQQPWGSDALLIAATGWGQARNKRESRDAGFDHHLVKPIEFAALDKLLRKSSG